MTDVKSRKNWSEKYPTEDTLGAVIVAWVVSGHWEIFEVDRRFESIARWALSGGWRGILRLARAHWVKHGRGLSFNGLKRLILEAKRLDNAASHKFVELVEWAEEISNQVVEEDYEDAMARTWLATRKNFFADGMSEATKRMFKDDFDAGVDGAMTVLERVRSMAEGSTAGLIDMADLAASAERDYGRSLGRPIATGFVPLDMTALGGIRLGHLWLLCGYASQGKSYFAREIGYRYAQAGYRVFLASFEMSEDDLKEYLIARMAHDIQRGGILIRDAVQRTLHDEDKKIYFEAARRWAAEDGPGRNFTIWVPDDEVTAMDVWRRAEVEHARRKIDLLIVDYSELLAPMSRRDEYRVRLGETIRIMKRTAMGLGRGDGTRVMLLHQTSRKGFDAALSRGYYLKQETAETSQAEKHADVIPWILQDDEMELAKEAKIGVAKNRTGPVKPLYYGRKVYADFHRSLITDLAPIEDEAPF